MTFYHRREPRSKHPMNERTHAYGQATIRGTLHPVKAAFLALVGASLLAMPMVASADDDTLHVYTSRKESLIKPLLDDFADLAGIKVEVFSAKPGVLIEKMKQEGRRTPADLFITVDISNIVAAKDQDLLRTVKSEVLTDRIPANLRDKDNEWFALSRRSRVVAYNPEAVAAADIATYQSLAGDAFNGKICVRSSSNAYNQALLASIIAHEGEAAALAWAKGVRANMARNPQGNDRDQIRAVAAGLCDVAIVNTYYLGLLLNSASEQDRRVGESVRLAFPEQDRNGQAGRGAHVNVSAMGMVKYSDNQKAARQMMEFLTSKVAQRFYGDVNHEYPVREGVAVSDTVAAWGTPKLDDFPVEQLSDERETAIAIFNQAGWQ